jgi:hypothetical protein
VPSKTAYGGWESSPFDPLDPEDADDYLSPEEAYAIFGPQNITPATLHGTPLHVLREEALAHEARSIGPVTAPARLRLVETPNIETPTPFWNGNMIAAAFTAAAAGAIVGWIWRSHRAKVAATKHGTVVGDDDGLNDLGAE